MELDDMLLNGFWLVVMVACATIHAPLCLKFSLSWFSAPLLPNTHIQTIRIDDYKRATERLLSYGGGVRYTFDKSECPRGLRQ
jgi:hypothetical protein